jgi:predicted phosphodiesterase
VAFYITGDTHGYHNIRSRLLGFMDRYSKDIKDSKEPSMLVVLGDFGLLFYEEEAQGQVAAIQSTLERYLPDLDLCFVAGNHENYDLIEALPQQEKWGGKVGRVSKNIYHLKSGEVFDFNGKVFAVYGGATSIDKHLRRNGYDWWPQELPSSREFLSLDRNLEKYKHKVDYLFTHTCAIRHLPLLRKYLPSGPIDDPVNFDIEIILENVEVRKLHAFGHFHVEIDQSDQGWVAAYEKIIKLED